MAGIPFDGGFDQYRTDCFQRMENAVGKRIDDCKRPTSLKLDSMFFGRREKMGRGRGELVSSLSVA
jgi:hypothetical protein